MANESAFRAIVDDAERAAANGDYVTAEQLLRQAVALQEADLGARHPALANTLNNLAVASEMANKPDEAEQSYRRAYAIATETLAPTDPLVATTEKNLRGFLETRGKVMEPVVVRGPLDAIEPDLASRPAPAAVSPAPDAAAVPPPQHVEADIALTPHDLPLEASASPAEVVRRDHRAPTRAIVAVVAAALVVLIVAARAWFGSETAPPAPDTGTPSAAVSEAAPSAAAPTAAPEQWPPPAAPSAAAPTAPPTAPPEQVPVEPTPPAATPAPVPPADAPAPERDAARQSATTGSPPAVATAELCLNLITGGGWRCEPATSPVRAGVLFFYTRIKSASNVTVQHRWYRGDRLFRVVDLQVGANANEGYRTYSRTTVNDRSAGEWRVELATKDGTVLHEEKFTVQ